MGLPTRPAMFACALAFAASSLTGCASAQHSGATADAVVDATYSGPQGEQIDGLPTYRNIQAALDAAPNMAREPYRIAIRAGRYHEKIVVKKPHIAFVGQDRDHTVLTYDAVAEATSPDGRPWGTSGSGTLIVKAPDFSAENMTIENSFDYTANRLRRPGDAGWIRNPQAVAVMTDNGADRSLFRNVRISGHQDTLYVDAGRSYFYRSIIAGHVDFILGAGQAVFEDCDLITLYRPDATPIGWVAAPSTQIGDHYGMVFLHSRLLRESNAVPAHSTLLGRPWHPTTSFADGRYADPNAIGSAVFVDCWMDEHISAEGWDAMGGTGRDGTRVMFSPQDARFFEYRSSGPGALVSDKRRQLSDAQAADYTLPKILGDWQPA